MNVAKMIKYMDTMRVSYGVEKETYSQISQELQKLATQIWNGRCKALCHFGKARAGGGTGFPGYQAMSRTP